MTRWFHLKGLIFIALACFSEFALAAKTYITTTEVQVYLNPEGELSEVWPDKTLFTSISEDDFWIEVSGHFPEGEWQPMSPHLFIRKTDQVQPRAVIHNDAPPMILHKALTARNTKARAYKILEDTYWYPSKKAALNAANDKITPQQNSDDAEIQPLAEEQQLKASEAPKTVGELEITPQPSLAPASLTDPIEQHRKRFMPAGTVITTNQEDRLTLKVTGHFPEGQWQPVDKTMWLAKPLKLQNRTQPKMYERQEGTVRFAVIDKIKFEVSVYEVINEEQTKLVTAPVALGYDRCLSAAKGGKCYYTPEGQFEIEFKLFDPDGIKWCVPKKMEAEFKQKLALGERCWRGIMGNHALHFGDSLFLHGTSNPNSIGSRTTHGCVRLRNSDIDVVFRLLADGDKVLISETPEEFDLVAIATQTLAEKQRKLAESDEQFKPAGGLQKITEEETDGSVEADTQP